MPRQNAPVVGFNHGLVSKLALARIDLTRLKFAAEQQDNWLPRTVGPMMLRPGLRQIGGTPSNAVTKQIPFVFAVNDTAKIEITSSTLRVRVGDTIVTRPAVSTAVTSGTFSSSTGWTLTNTGGATSSINSGGNGVLILSAVALGSKASCTQTLTIAGGDQNVLHALRIVINRGPVRFRAGSAAGLDDYIGDTSLDRGEHSLAFTPTGASVFIRFDSSIRYPVIVDSCLIEAAGQMTLPTPYVAADYPLLRWAQSGDIIFIACEGRQQQKIERRGTYSWSFVQYLADDGPFHLTPRENVAITPDATIGEINLTADVTFFRSDMVGGLLRLVTTSQQSSGNIAAAGTFLRPIRVTGVSQGSGAGGTFATGSRQFNLHIGGTWTGTITLQRSFDSEDTGFEDVSNYTANTDVAVADTFDNSIVWYRLGFKTGNYGSGTAELAITYPGGGFAGVVRIASVSSPTAAIADVLSQLSAPVATRDWQLGMWSDLYGWPSAVSIYLGRIYWLGRDRIWGSVADAYQSFNAELEGEAGPISRSIGYGPVQTINWALPLSRLILGTGGSEVSLRTSATDEPITPTNFGLKDVSTQGSAKIAAVKVDARGIFVQRSLRRVYQLLFDPNTFDYSASDLTALLPDLGVDFVCVDVQRQPDTRIYFVRADGTVLVLLFEPSEEVTCWYTISSGGAGGFIEDVCVLPGTPEDEVNFIVRRTINGSTVRYVERLAPLSQAVGGVANTIADSHIYYSGAPVTTITGLSHLEGQTVVVWGNGKDLGTKVVSGGQITGLSEAVTTACVGLGYNADFKSAKLAYAAGQGTALAQKKRISHLGLICKDTHNSGVTFGPDFDHLDPLPGMYQGAAVTATQVYGDFDEPAFEFPGEWSTDSRLCLRASAPKPCTVLGAIVTMSTNDHPPPPEPQHAGTG